MKGKPFRVNGGDVPSASQRRRAISTLPPGWSCPRDRRGVGFHALPRDNAFRGRTDKQEETPMARAKAAARPAPQKRSRLLVATRKGLWTLTGDASRNGWRLAGPQFLGHSVHHALADPRDGRTLLAAARTGHLGPTIFRSTDSGRTWKEATRPPAFAEGSGCVVDHTFWLTPGHMSARRRRDCSARPTRARRGKASAASIRTRSARRGAAATRTERPMVRSCTRSSSIRATRRTCTSACRAAACSNRPTQGRTGGR